jgi:hypothetical protein
MQIRAVDPEVVEQGGSSTFSITRAGDFEVSVALCDDEGCAESVPIDITVFGEAGMALLDSAAAQRARVSAIAADLEARVAYWEGQYGPSEYWRAEARYQASAVGFKLFAKTVGKALFKGAVGHVGGEGMSQFMQVLGYDENAQQTQIQNALSDVADSVNALHDKVEAMRDQLTEIANQIDDATGKAMWDSFRTNDNSLRREVLPPIIDLFNLTGLWSDSNPPSQTQVERYVADVRQAMIAVDQVLVGDQGALTLLLEALDYPDKVSDMEAYWAFVNDYRDEWQAVLAQGLLGLEYIRDFDTADGYAAHQLTQARKLADRTVEAMWAAGLPLPNPTPQTDGLAATPYLHLLGSDWVVARPFRPEFPGEEWYVLETQAELEPRIQALVDSYRSDLNGGQSLAMWLVERGLPYEFPILDTVKQRPDGGFMYTSIKISGNQLKYASVSSPSTQPPRFVPKFLDVERNLGGRPARFDVDAIRGHAFGFDFNIPLRDDGMMILYPANPFGAPWLRVVDTETGALIDELPQNSLKKISVTAESTITLQWGAYGDYGEWSDSADQIADVFQVDGEMHFVIPSTRFSSGTYGVHLDTRTRETGMD